MLGSPLANPKIGIWCTRNLEGAPYVSSKGDLDLRIELRGTFLFGVHRPNLSDLAEQIRSIGLDQIT